MADRPILFSAPMIKALLAGRKSQTRRVFKGIEQLPNGNFHIHGPGGGIVGVREEDVPNHALDYARISVGDRLWVKENHAIVPRTAYRMSEGVQQTLKPGDDHDAAVYAAEWERSKPGRWRPSIHMPRWASRLTLTVTDVRVERLTSISEEDARAEGVEPSPTHPGWWLSQTAGKLCPTARDAYGDLWNAINGEGSWQADPWVAAYSFEVHHANIDQMAKEAA